MSVLIKGMSLPLMCEECPCYDCNDYSCNTTGCGVIEYRYDGRPDNCPLTELPTPHGRLIDADKAAHSILMMSSHPCGCSIENVKDVVEWLKFINGDGNNFAFPTIIEAEVSE